MRLVLLLMLLLCQLALADLVSRTVFINPDGSADVQETHTFKLKEGDNTVLLEGMAGSLLRDSFELVPSSGYIFEKRLLTSCADIIDAAQNARGHHVTVHFDCNEVYHGVVRNVVRESIDAEPGRRKAHNMLMLTTDGGSTLAISLNRVSLIEFDSDFHWRDDSTCRFVWNTERKQEARVDVKYSLHGIYGLIEYSGILSHEGQPKSDTFEVNFKLWNYCGSSLQCDSLVLLHKGGDPWYSFDPQAANAAGQRFPDYRVSQYYMGSPFRQDRMPSNTQKRPVESTILENVRIPNGTARCIALPLPLQGAPAEIFYYPDTSKLPPGKQSIVRCKRMLKLNLANTDIQNLPPGVFQFRSEEGEPLGSHYIQIVWNEASAIFIDEDEGLHLTRNQAGQEREPRHRRDEHMIPYTILNSHSYPCEIWLTDEFPDNYAIRVVAPPANQDPGSVVLPAVPHKEQRVRRAKARSLN